MHRKNYMKCTTQHSGMTHMNAWCDQVSKDLAENSLSL